MSILFLPTLILPMMQVLVRLLPEQAVPVLLFGGQIEDLHKTKFAFKEVVDRYKSGIDEVNRSLVVSMGLAVIALYAYFALPVSGTVHIPIIGLEISRQLWIRVVPAISYVIQIFAFTSFIWFMLLRLGLRMLLNQQTGANDDFGDVTNISLKGAIGHLWLVLQIKAFYRSRWNYLWYAPALITVLAVFLSPLVVCGFFVDRLFAAGEIGLALVYSGFLLPSLMFFVLLAGTTAILGVGESAIRVSTTRVKIEIVTPLVNETQPLARDDSE